MSVEEYHKLGEARIVVSEKAKTPEDWKRMWQPPRHDYVIEWGSCWKHCIEYKVERFAAEVGFFIDILGLPINAFGRDYAMFTSPDKEFFFSFSPAKGKDVTPSNAIRIQFMVNNIMELTKELERRGVEFDERPGRVGGDNSPMYTGYFRTPNGICVDIWGLNEDTGAKHER